MKSIADCHNPSLPSSILCGEEAWQHVQANILTPLMVKMISSHFGGVEISGRGAIMDLIQWARETEFFLSFDSDGHLLLVFAVATWIKVKTKAGELPHFDWRLLQPEAFGSDFQTR